MNEGLDQWSRLTKNFSGPFNEWTTTTSEICRRTIEQNLTLISEHLDRLSSQCKRLSTAKKPEEFISSVKDYVTAESSEIVKDVEKLLHLSVENIQEISKLYNQSLRESYTAATKTTGKVAEKVSDR